MKSNEQIKNSNIMEVTVMLIPIVSTISIVVMVIFIRKYTNDERMAMIEKGVDANLLASKSNSYPNLRYGLLFIGAGLGLLVGSLLDNARIVEEEAAYFSMLFIFGGLGLFASYFLEKRAADQEKKD
jgi:hypothetical protein